MPKECWTERGCDAEMAAVCPHATASEDKRCVAECYYASCQRPQHKVTTAFDLYFDPTIDRTAAIKETCTFCEFFLTHGPKRSL